MPRTSFVFARTIADLAPPDPTSPLPFLCVSAQLTAQAGRFWAEIMACTVAASARSQPGAGPGGGSAPLFFRRDAEVRALRAASAASVARFGRALLGAGGERRRLLVSEVQARAGGAVRGPAEAQLAYVNRDRRFVEVPDAVAFRKDLRFVDH